MISVEALHKNMLSDEAHGRAYIKNTGVRFYTTNMVCGISVMGNMDISLEGFIKHDAQEQLSKFFEYIEEPKEKFIAGDGRGRVSIKCKGEHLSVEPFDDINLKLLYGANNEI